MPMSERVRVVQDGSGRLVAAKTSRPGDAERLRAEALLLERLALPGVVELVGPVETDPVTATATLCTRWVGSRSLADLPRPVAPERAAGLVLAVAATVASLHRLGVVHGHLHASHVLLDPQGRPVLCGFGGSGPIGAPVRRTATDPAQDRPPHHDGEAVLRPSEDVAGLGTLLADLLGGDDPTRPAGGRRRRHGQRTRRRALLAIATRATAADGASRPSVGSFIGLVRRAAPEAELLDGPDLSLDDGERNAVRGGWSAMQAPDSFTTSAPTVGPGSATHPAFAVLDLPDDRRPVGRWLPAAVVLLVAGLAAFFGLSALLEPPSAGAGRPSPQSPTVAGTAPSTTAPMAEAATSSTTTTTATTTNQRLDAVAVTPAPEVEFDGQRYAVGQPGDVAAVGEWLCDGRATVVLLRPSTGGLYLFDRWASLGSTSTARPSTVIPDSRSLGTDSRRTDGCPRVVVGLADGRSVTVPTEDLR